MNHLLQLRELRRDQARFVLNAAGDFDPALQEILDVLEPAQIQLQEAVYALNDYLDKVGLSTAEFYLKLRTEVMLPRTSQPPPGDFRRQFEFLLSHHPSLVYLGVARAVSGTIQSAALADFALLMAQASSEI